MKRFFAVILIAALCVTLCLTLSGCDSPEVRVESVMDLTKEFKGSRVITVVYPLSADIDAIKEDIISDCPAHGTDGVSFTYLGATENGYSFELKLSFDNAAEYEAQASAVIGRDANAVLACKQNAMFSGTRMAEDFDVSDMIEWIIRDTKSASATKDYTFAYPYNKVTVGGKAYDTGSTVSVNDGSGIQVNCIDVKTYNEKASLLGRTFDRSFVFTIPADTYAEKKRSINAYFEELSDGGALITDTHEGNNILYTVTYEGLSLSELEETTAAMLDSDGVSIFYGDKGNMSTPLFEGRVLEETLDTLSFSGPEGNPPTLKYTYSLPTNAVRGEGAVYQEGGWKNTGTWDDGAYRMEDASGLTHLRIFDGRQYSIDGVNIELTAQGDGTFRRVTSFLYLIKDGFEGPVYAAKFFRSKNADTTADNDDEHIICSVICEGDPDEINASLENIFGKGNYIAYERKSGALSDKTTYIDYIDLRETLSVENAAISVTYTASAENGENIVTLTNGGSETAYKNSSDSRLEIAGGPANVGYHGVIPKAGNILLYIIFGVALFAVTTLIAYRMLVPPIRRERASFREPDPDVVEDTNNAALTVPFAGEPSPNAPTQTTTFSIFELGLLSRNKMGEEEMDRDVENRMKADRLKARRKEQRRKEVEEMEKLVYGKEETPSEESGAVPAQADDSQPADRTPRTIEILEAFDEASKEEPETPEPTDPMELLNLVNGEDEDD